jgi:hypothetical protein
MSVHFTEAVPNGSDKNKNKQAMRFVLLEMSLRHLTAKIKIKTIRPSSPGAFDFRREKTDYRFDFQQNSFYCSSCSLQSCHLLNGSLALLVL